MDLLQFSLFFAALLVGYVLIHLRLVRFELYLKEMGGIRTLNQRLESLASALERVDLSRVEEMLGQLHDDLRAVQRATHAVEEAVAQAGAPAPRVEAAVEAGPASPAQRAVAVTEARLLQLGYGGLRILTDLEGAGDGDLELQVECERNGMPCKGRVVVRNGAVRDVQIQTVHQAFP